MAKAERIIAVDINDGKEEMARALGATDFVNPKKFDKPIQQVIVDMTDGGVDYSFECVGNTQLMRAALECCHKGWGESTIIGVAGAGPGDLDAAVPARDGPRLARQRVRRRQRPHRSCPGMVDQYMDGKIKVDEMITHTMGLEDINQAFDLMHEGKSIRSVIHF